MILSKFSLASKVAIVTGSGKGIGKGIAIGLAEAGADVVVTARTAADIEATASEVRSRGRNALPVVADVRQYEQVQSLVNQTVEKFGKIDILVNNVGGSFRHWMLEVSENAWDAIVRANLKSVFLCSQAVGKVMMEQKKGSIINIASRAGRAGEPRMAAYGAAKAAVVNLTQTLALEWAPHIRVNCIAPGVIETPGLRWSRSAVVGTENLEKHLAELAKSIPLGRMGQIEDVAASVVFLASEASSWITGITIDLNGGSLQPLPVPDPD
ncbi:MAG: SDR family NAD(P)-dependent oxidoreductase [Dehalococcoidales bacterium]|nr:SDR family NAD(P)-dependent oxidoreductase [Dehalococcoidales bacterium]